MTHGNFFILFFLVLTAVEGVKALVVVEANAGAYLVFFLIFFG